MDSLRSKNGFDFESTDNTFPYGRLDGIEVGTRKFVLFNYSTTYFRRKQANKNELDFISGGNIPSDMSNQVTISTEENSSLTCSLIGGNATSLGVVPVTPIPNSAVINLSPNNILEVPTICDDKWPPEKEILYEKARQQKPNFIYFPAYQSSASTHPRARGYAHEDNYDCLKKPFGEGSYSPDITSNPFTCCNYYCNCPTFKGFFINTGDNFNPAYPEGVFRPIAGNTNAIFGGGVQNLEIGTHCCNGFPIGFEDECSNECNFGYAITVTRTTGKLKGVCPDKTSDNGAAIEAVLGSVSKFYKLSGNTNCSCSGRGGTVVLGGSITCTKCTYQDFSGNSFKEIVEKKCSGSNSSFNGIICSCIFNDKIDIGGTDIYITTMSYPTFKYTDGQLIEITDTGEIVSKNCQPTPKICNDLN